MIKQFEMDDGKTCYSSIYTYDGDCYCSSQGWKIRIHHEDITADMLMQSIRLYALGPTEITVDCTYYIVDRVFEDNESLPIGMECRNTNVLILNKENKECEIGEIGELCVRGSSLAHGYYNDWEKTREVFVQNPLNKSYPEKIYRTGDLVFFNKRKEITFVGRKDNQIKHAGYRIELGEIENAITTSAFVDIGCLMYDEVNKQIVLFYEAKQEIDNSKLRIKLLNSLPKYMIPTKTIKLKSLPLNSNGKINRLQIRKEYLPL